MLEQPFEVVQGVAPVADTRSLFTRSLRTGLDRFYPSLLGISVSYISPPNEDLSEPRALEVCRGERRALKLCSDERRALEVCRGEQRALKLCSVERRALEVC